MESDKQSVEKKGWLEKKNKESQKIPFIFKCLSANFSKDIFHYLFYNVSFDNVDGVRFGRQRGTQVRSHNVENPVEKLTVFLC